MWRQIANRLEEALLSQALSPGDRLPTESALASHFGVNRHTVRRAVGTLEQQGLVRVEQGRGTFVHGGVLDYRVGRRTRFSENLHGQGRRPSGDLLSSEEVPATAEVAKALRMRAGAAVTRLEFLGYADERPITLGGHHFPARRFRALPEVYRRHASITDSLRELGVEDYERRSTRVIARLPTTREQQLLEIGRNRPVLVTESINVDLAGEVIEYGVTCFPGDRVQLVLNAGS